MIFHGCIGNPCKICNNGTIQTSQQMGWICPNCGVSNSPWMRTCGACFPAPMTIKIDRTSSCLCRKENGGSGICGCVLGNQVIS